MSDQKLDPEQFEQVWIKLSEQVIQIMMSDSVIKEIKDKVRSQGHIELEDRESFISKVNEIKNDLIEKQFGNVESEQYKNFAHEWQNWLKVRGVNRPKPENMFEENIAHLLFGSTPNPDLFLRDFDLYKDVE